jgi:hypothetical protein
MKLMRILTAGNEDSPTTRRQLSLLLTSTTSSSSTQLRERFEDGVVVAPRHGRRTRHVVPPQVATTFLCLPNSATAGNHCPKEGLLPPATMVSRSGSGREEKRHYRSGSSLSELEAGELEVYPVVIW